MTHECVVPLVAHVRPAALPKFCDDTTVQGFDPNVVSDV